MKTDDYIKYLLTEFIRFIEEPTKDRRQRKLKKKEEQKLFSQRWFGIIPISLAILGENIKKKLTKKQ